jgi:hypothetical protein
MHTSRTKRAHLGNRLQTMSAVGSLSPPAVALHVCLPILIGAAIYLLWRSPTLWVFGWIDAVGLGAVLASIRQAVPTAAILPPWVLYSVPDGLWVYAGTAFFARLWSGSHSASRWVWLLAMPCLGLGSELGQGLQLIPGTFDLADLTAYATATVLALLWAGGSARLSSRRAVCMTRADRTPAFRSDTHLLAPSDIT